MRTAYELYLVRHGLAEERGEAWPDDTKRPLTEEGMSRLRRAAHALARLELPADVVLTSPLVRTRQTAEILAGALSPHPPLINVDVLAPGRALGAAVRVPELDWHARAIPHYDYLLDQPTPGAMLAGGHCIPVLLRTAER